MKLPTLFSKASSGVIQEWTIEIDGDRYRTIAGQQDGTLTTSKWSICEGKNIGRSNETTPEAQALSEAKSKWKHKKEHGGAEQTASAGTIAYVSPMLAKTWQKLKKQPAFPLYTQYKFNGIRCVITRFGMWTRHGKQIISCPHIWEAVEDLFVIDPDLVLDGELYNHELGETLNRIIKLVRKTKNVPVETLIESKKYIRFYNYDGFNVNGLGMDAPYLTRKQALGNLLKDIPEVYIVETEEIKNNVELDAHFEKCKQKKYEGQMIRVNGPYKLGPGRSNTLIKRKTFLDEEYLVIGINEGTGNASGMAATFTCQTEDKQTFNSNLKGPDSLMIEIWNNKDDYIGKMFTCTFQNLSEYGIPQFPYIDPTVSRDYE